MSTAESPLPVFRKPPVVETVLGVQFQPIPGLMSAHLGTFWKWLRENESAASAERWTSVADAPALEPVFEEGQAWLPEHLRLRLSKTPQLRLQIRNESGDAMIQVQNGRFHYNWIGQAETHYRRYKTIRPAFDRTYEALRRFLQTEKLPDPKENQ